MRCVGWGAKYLLLQFLRALKALHLKQSQLGTAISHSAEQKCWYKLPLLFSKIFEVFTNRIYPFGWVESPPPTSARLLYSLNVLMLIFQRKFKLLSVKQLVVVLVYFDLTLVLMGGGGG